MSSKGERLFDSQRACRLMDEASLDIIIASRRHNVGYLTGQFSIVYWEYPEVAHCLEREDDGCNAPYYFAGIPKEQSLEAFVIAHSNRAHIFSGRCWIKDVKPCCDLEGKKNAVQCIVEGIRERGLEKSRIGVEMNHLPAGVFHEIKNHLKEATFCDAAGVLWKMRMVKTATEIERLKKAYSIAENIYKEVFRLLKGKDDVTAGEIRAMEMAMAIEAGCPPLHFGYVSPGYSVPKSGARTQDEPIKKGDVMLMDIGLVYEGYTTDFGRVAVLGKAEGKVKDAYSALCETRNVMAKAMKPGVKASDVYRITAQHRPHLQIPQGASLGHGGHGLGIECHEPPVIAPYDDTVLENNMTIVIEIGGGVDGFGFLLEDGGIITDEGWKSLTKLGTEIFEI